MVQLICDTKYIVCKYLIKEADPGKRYGVNEENVAHVIDIAEEKARYDAEVKHVLSDKIILAWIISRTVAEFEGMTIAEIIPCIEGEPLVSKVYVAPGKTNGSIVGRDTQDKVPKEGEARFDILFHVSTPYGKRIKIIINVEAQQNFYPGYDLVTRGVYYGARLLSSQKEREFTGSHYDDIKKVYSIWVCMNAPNYLQNTITEYSMQQRKIYGNYSKPARYDLLTVIMICLGKPDGASNEENDYQKLLHLLSVLADEKMAVDEKLHIMESEFDIAVSNELEGRVNAMCNWSDGVVERVTTRVTQQVTQQVTQRVSNEKDVSGVENIMRAFQVSAERACEVLQISFENYLSAKAAMSNIR